MEIPKSTPTKTARNRMLVILDEVNNKPMQRGFVPDLPLGDLVRDREYLHIATEEREEHNV